MMQSKRYAVTGGIGSGKSLVLGMLKARGYPVFSCDDISRSLWNSPAYRKELAILFPSCAERGEAVREKLAALVFSDGEALARLEEFSHPRILKELLPRMAEHKVSFAEVPLLFEKGLGGLFDGILAIRREKEARTEAVMARDGLKKEQVALRMARQFDPDRLEEMPCVILENDGAPEELEGKLDRALGELVVI